MKLRCCLSSLLRIHHPDCQYCKARESYGIKMRKRLAEFGWGTEPCLPELNSQPAEVIILPVSLKARKRSA